MPVHPFHMVPFLLQKVENPKCESIIEHGNLRGKDKPRDKNNNEPHSSENYRQM